MAIGKYHCPYRHGRADKHFPYTQQRNKKFFLPILWKHDTEMPLNLPVTCCHIPGASKTPMPDHSMWNWRKNPLCFQQPVAQLLTFDPTKTPIHFQFVTKPSGAGKCPRASICAVLVILKVLLCYPFLPRFVCILLQSCWGGSRTYHSLLSQRKVKADL